MWSCSSEHINKYKGWNKLEIIQIAWIKKSATLPEQDAFKILKVTIKAYVDSITKIPLSKSVTLWQKTLLPKLLAHILGKSWLSGYKLLTNRT